MGYTMHDTPDSHRKPGRQRKSPAAVLLIVFTVSLLAAPAAAHSPTGMDISFDPVTAKISVSVTHPVDDPATHYLKTIRVKLNGDVISDPDYKSQPDKVTVTHTYDVNAHAGDTIDVTVICNQGGTLEKSYKIPQPVRITTSAQVPSTYTTPPPATAGPTAKSSMGLVSLLGAVAAVLVIKRK
jgi:hypothetical protein